VLLLVYHFKNRITVAEKKSDSMYGLLTAVVKEIKTLRGMFGLGGQVESDTSNRREVIDASLTPVVSNELKSKTNPEVNVSTSSSSNNNFAAFVEKTSGIQREVITLDFAAADNKIVVSYV
jgi:hypothetical protein